MAFILLAFLWIALQSLSAQVVPKDSLSGYKRFAVPADTTTKTQAEEIEQLKKDILRLDKELTNTKMNLSYYHKEYKTGTFLKIAGAAVFVLGVALATTNHHARTRGKTVSLSSQYLAIPIIGALSFISGEILCIHSHKYVGKAGRKLMRTAQ